jgi:acetyltransferase-like isoleucine patch superfamily enzyme
MRGLIATFLPLGSSRRWVLSGILRNPLTFPFSLLSSLHSTFRLTGTFFPVLVRISAGQRLRLYVHKAAKTQIKGVLSVSPWGGSNQPSSLAIGEDAIFELSGDFEIGPNVHLSVTKNGQFHVAGVRDSSASGITCDSRIMVERSVTIGADSIIAWNVFISDSDWHEIENSSRTAPVIIGNHVWIGHGVSVLKGSHVPDGCIVGTHSVVRGAGFPNNSLLAGNPAALKREGVKWRR